MPKTPVKSRVCEHLWHCGTFRRYIHPYYISICIFQFDNKKAWVSKLRDDNTVEVKRIDEKDIQFYLENNWVKGRKGILKLPKIRKSVKGDKNPAFGKVHVHKLENNKIIRTLINKDELENYLNNGWITGIKNKSNQK